MDNCSSVSLEKDIFRFIFLSVENSCELNETIDVERVEIGRCNSVRSREHGILLVTFMKCGPKPMLCNVCMCSLLLPDNGGSGGG